MNAEQSFTLLVSYTKKENFAMTLESPSAIQSRQECNTVRYAECVYEEGKSTAPSQSLQPVCSHSRVSSCRSYPEGAENVSSRTRLMDREYELCKSRVNGASVIGIMLVPTLHFRRRIEIMYPCYPDTRLGYQRYFDPLPNHSASAAVRRSSRRPIAVARSPRSHTREQGP